MSDVGPSSALTAPDAVAELLRWCYGLREPLRSRFLASRRPRDVDALAVELHAVQDALRPFRANAGDVDGLTPAGGRAALRGLGPVVHYLRRCAGAGQTLAVLFVLAQDRDRMLALADQLRAVKLAVHAFRDRRPVPADVAAAADPVPGDVLAEIAALGPLVDLDALAAVDGTER